jgi:phage FluMu protein gp41
MQTEFPFVLPRGYLAPDGTVHREGVLRLATAADEIVILGDPRVQANRAYAVVLLFSRVIARLGDLEGEAITPEVVEGLFASDLAYLQDLYRQVNGVTS